MDAEILILDYYDLRVFLLRSDPKPVHIYASFQNRRMRAVVVFKSGIHWKNELETVDGYEPLQEKEKSDFLLLLEGNLPFVIKSWQDHFIYALPVKPEIIMTRLG